MPASLAESAAPPTEGEVRVSIHTAAPPERAWRALTDPGVVARWFAELRGALRPGEGARFDFGDGDFFAVETLEVDPPYALRYAWRFLGTGPRDTISWEVVPENGGSRVAVLDEEPGRTREAAAALREGWLDFTSRLERHLETGEDTRYDWRRDLDGSVELATPLERARGLVLERGALSRWLPLEGATLEDGARWRVDDGAEPASLTVAGVQEDPSGEVRFRLSHPGWMHPTECTIALHPRGDGALLVFGHQGWEEISADPAESRRQRCRLAGSWVAALSRARALAG